MCYLRGSQGGIVGVAFSTATEKGCSVRHIQGRIAAQSWDQIRVSNKKATKRNEIRTILTQRFFRCGAIIAVICDVGALKGAAQCLLIERHEVSCALGVALYDMHIANTNLC